LAGVFECLSASAIAEMLTASPTLYIFANAAHILAIGLLVGAILPLDLRLLGIFRGPSLQVLGPFLSRVAMCGVGLAIVTGGILFTVRAGEYAQNPAFVTKLVLLGVGIINAVLLHTVAPWHRVVSEGVVAPPVRLLAGLSIIIWISALIAGRWIGFV
jgi:hypothetical protein